MVRPSELARPVSNASSSISVADRRAACTVDASGHARPQPSVASSARIRNQLVSLKRQAIGKIQYFRDYRRREILGSLQSLPTLLVDNRGSWPENGRSRETGRVKTRNFRGRFVAWRICDSTSTRTFNGPAQPPGYGGPDVILLPTSQTSPPQASHSEPHTLVHSRRRPGSLSTSGRQSYSTDGIGPPCRFRQLSNPRP